jgi:hypothetical protein
MNLNWFDKDELFPKVIEQLQKVDIVLDIGCGIRPQNYICPLVHICCEPFEEYSEILIDKANQQTDRRFIILKAGWEETVKLFAPKSVDTIFLLDVIEHLDKEKGEELLRLTESIARKQVVIFTPLGYVPQEHPDGIDAWGLNGGAWQEHKSGWMPNDFNDSWDIYACKEFHFIDHNGNPFDAPYGAFWAIKTFDSEKTKVLFLVQSCIPEAKQDEYLPILKNTIHSIKQQTKDNSLQVHIVISDDGSGYLKDLIDSNINIGFLSQENLDKVNQKYNLNINELVYAPESEYFRKADLFNFYLKQKGNLYDLVIFLDDDHNFVKNDSLERFVKHYKQGYNFIVGRYYHPACRFRTVNNGMYNWGIQGTTYAVSYSILETINFFSESVREWGFAEDYDIFRKAYLSSLKSDVKAVFDGNIITVDNISGRWQYCINKIGGFEIGVKKFEEEHGITFKKAAIGMEKWMSVIPDEYGLSEFIIQNIDLEDYFSFGKLLQKSKISLKEIKFIIIWRKIRWKLVMLRSNFSRLFLSERQIEFVKNKIRYQKPTQY